MKYDKINRRYFLQGLGGSLLALPILPSLLPRAHAQTLPDPKYLVMFGSGHGGVGNIGDWEPMAALNPNSPLFNQLTMLNANGGNPAHIVRHAMLNNLLTTNVAHMGGNVDNGQARLSYILGSFLNPHLSKMNFYDGIDIGTFYSGHHRGVYGGNLSAPVNNVEARDTLEPWPTLDQFLGESNKFYPNPDQISLKSITNNATMSHAADGTRLPATANRIDRYYNAIFSKYENSSDPAEIARRTKKNFLVDRVYEDYKRLITGNTATARRISSLDKSRVEDHISRLYDVQNKHKNFISSCGDVTGPTDRAFLGNHSANPPGIGIFEAYSLLNDLIVSAFSCGATKASGVLLSSAPLGWTGDYHQEVVHQHNTDPAMQLEHNRNFRANAERIVTDLVSKLDAVSVTGQTGSILDNGLVTWTQECGRITHQHTNVGLVTFGSLGGFFNTGNYVDYRNHDNFGLRRSPTSSARPGISITRFWANVIQGFGYTPAEYERNSNPGYGDSSLITYTGGRASNTNGHIPYPPALMNSLSDRLPVVTS